MKVILVINMGQTEPEITIVGANKGSAAAPKRLKIASKTKLIVYRKGDKLVVAKLLVPPLREELSYLFQRNR